MPANADVARDHFGLLSECEAEPERVFSWEWFCMETSPLAETDGMSGPVLILGLARSGTTWLAKCFDSHPDTLYRHEPDIGWQAPGLPLICLAQDWVRYQAQARADMRRLLASQHLKSVGPPPFFHKNYRAPAAALRREVMTEWWRLAELMPWTRAAAQRAEIGDYLDPTKPVRLVLKSVNASGRTGLLAEALPAATLLYMVRHPCGQIASRLRGIRLGRMGMPASAQAWEQIARLPQAGAYGLTQARYAALSQLEQLAWHWVVLNEKALADLDGRWNVRFVAYEALCRSPVTSLAALFEFAGLALDPQTELFVAKSTQFRGLDRYYRVLRNTQATAVKWRGQLSALEQGTILDIARQSTKLAPFLAD